MPLTPALAGYPFAARPQGTRTKRTLCTIINIAKKGEWPRARSRVYSSPVGPCFFPVPLQSLFSQVMKIQLNPC